MDVNMKKIRGARYSFRWVFTKEDINTYFLRQTHKDRNERKEKMESLKVKIYINVNQNK